MHGETAVLYYLVLSSYAI